MRKVAIGAGAAVLALILALCSAPALARTYPPILGFKFIPSLNLHTPTIPVPLWMDMLRRWHNGAPCAPALMGACTTIGWRQALNKGHGLSGLPLLNAINDAFNAPLYPYRHEDGDYWETPYEFLAKSGDCEDYAVAKYMALKALGVPEQDMVIVTVMLKLRAMPEGHAILIVFLGNQGWVLDILNKKLMPQASAAILYMPLVAVNSTFWTFIHNVT